MHHHFENCHSPGLNPGDPIDTPRVAHVGHFEQVLNVRISNHWQVLQSSILWKFRTFSRFFPLLPLLQPAVDEFWERSEYSEIFWFSDTEAWSKESPITNTSISDWNKSATDRYCRLAAHRRATLTEFDLPHTRTSAIIFIGFRS